MELGVGKYDASYLLSAIGISNLMGKIGLGLISDRPWINRLYLYCICVGTCGLSELLIRISLYQPINNTRSY